MDFTIDLLNPYATTPPQVIRAIPISHELQLARQNQLHHWCVPFVDGVTRICLRCDFQCIHGLNEEGGMLRFHVGPARTTFIAAVICTVLQLFHGLRVPFPYFSCTL